MRTATRLMGPESRPAASLRWRALGLAATLFSMGFVAPAVSSIEAAEESTRSGVETAASTLDARRMAPERLASRTNPTTPLSTGSTRSTRPSRSSAGETPDPVTLAKRYIADCQARYAGVDDYTCTFVKRERVDGVLQPQHVMYMKTRVNPRSFYFKFATPNKGREAIWVAGRHNEKVVAHDVGFGKLIAGTLYLDPRGTMAMGGCRHPITEAGIGALIDEVARHWELELSDGESDLRFHPGMHIGGRSCTMIESTHPSKQAHFKFHKVKLYVDDELGLPIRVEAYDWPKKSGAAADLLEEYSYLDLRVNVGLTDADFDPSNTSYAYGRF